MCVLLCPRRRTPLAHAEFNWLEQHVNFAADPQSPFSVFGKIALDQLVVCPMGLACFFIIMACLEGRPTSIPEALRTK